MAMGRYAIVVGGVVWSVTQWDPVAAPAWAPPSGGTAVLLSGQQLIDAVPGATYNSGTFVFTPPLQQIALVKAAKQAELIAYFRRFFDLTEFVLAGSLNTVTVTQLNNFQVQIINNERTLRANIAAAATISAVNAIDLTAGWPSNP